MLGITALFSKFCNGSINPACELIASDERHDIGDAKAARRSHKCKTETIHHLTHRPFVASDELLKWSFESLLRKAFLADLVREILYELSGLKCKFYILALPELRCVLLDILRRSYEKI